MNTQLLTVSVSLCLLSSSQAQEDPLAGLAANIPGLPGQDYPIFAFPPETSFQCDGNIQGYYADQESDCQTFHICADDGNDGLFKYSFLCPNGTLFNQEYFICDWWFNVDCSVAEDFYALNADIAEAAANANNDREGRAEEDGGEFVSYDSTRQNRGK
eukprot:GFUD01044655.1.p1 GENE.GFUD01044655.1~~GFUD01044655.1.p1  ORF type:complete len:158 (+),score=52.45 GFUD01044655.1:236-709(+)